MCVHKEKREEEGTGVLGNCEDEGHFIRAPDVRRLRECSRAPEETTRLPRHLRLRMRSAIADTMIVKMSSANVTRTFSLT